MSACRSRSPWPTAARRSSSTTSARTRSTSSTRARMPFAEPGAEPVLRAGLRQPACSRRRPTRRWSPRRSNVIVVIGTPVDEHLNPDPTAIPEALEPCSEYFRDGQLLILRSTVYPGVTALVEQMVADLGLDIDVAFCPERIAEHKAMEELFTPPADRVLAHRRTAAQRAAALFGTLTDEIVAPRARGGRAREAVHQHLALHQVRRGEPVLHDGQRPRARLRADPQGPHARLPARAGPARPGFRRRAVPVQGHHAAGRVQRQHVRPRPLGDARQRGPAAVPGQPAGEAVRPREHDRRHPRHVVQGRLRRHPLEPVLQAAPGAEVQGQGGARHRPARHRGGRRHAAAARRGARRRPTC